MATFEAQVEGLTSLSIDGSSAPTQTELTQFLTDGAKEIINILPPNLLDWCAAQQTFTSVMPGSEDEIMNTGKILRVYRNDGDFDRVCRRIRADEKGYANDPDEMGYASVTDPVFYTENNKLNALPEAGSCKYDEVQYPTVNYAHSSIGSISLTVVTATAADPTVFTKSSHGLSTGDVVELSGFQDMTEINGMTGTVTKLDANTFEVNGISADPAETRGGSVVKLGGFPDEAEYLVVLYGAVKSLQNVLGDKSSNSDISTAIGLIKTAVDQAATAAGKFLTADSDSIFGDEETFLTANSQLTRVKGALDNAEAVINGDAPSTTTDAYGALSAEDTEIVTSALSIATSEISRAQAHLSEWTAIGDMRVKEVNVALSEADGQVKVIQAHISQASAKRAESQSRLSAGNAYLQEATSIVSQGNAYIAEAQAYISQAQGYASEVSSRAGFSSAKSQAIQGHISTAQAYVSTAQGFGSEVQSKTAIAQAYGSEIQSRLAVDSAHYGWYEKQQAKLQADYEGGIQKLLGGYKD